MFPRSFSLLCVVMLVVGTAQGAVVIETVPVGNPGNAPDTRYNPSGYGGVSYEYNIGKYEVTNAQWREFLAAKASVSDPYGLYNTDMAGTYGGIDRTWSVDHYVYTAKGGDSAWDNRPVNHVSFWDAARFCNWLHNGQGSGDTESGAYVNIGNQDTFARQSGAEHFVPTENEWYKASYYDPSDYDPDGSGGIDPGPGYWLYPTQSDTAPTAEVPAGTDMTNGSANYWNGSSYVDPEYGTTEVGAYTAKPSDSAYGTFDQGGNLWEWNETAIGSSRGLRGGDWSIGSSVHLAASDRYLNYPTYEHTDIGFRVASSQVVPAPSSAVCVASLFAMAAIASWWRRRRNR